MKTKLLTLFALLLAAASANAANEIPTSYAVCVSNEKSGDISVIVNNSLVNTIPVGKRPRGIHASPDGKYIYVALSGTPVGGPPKLDAQGNPIFEREDEKESDHTADAIGVVDVQEKKLVKKLPAGSDPEQFAVSNDGNHIYISNEDTGEASVMNVGNGKVESKVQVAEEPEGVVLTPDGRFCYVTCETRGEVFVIDAKAKQVVAQFTVGGRPRNVAFTPDGTRAFIPSETTGFINVIDGKLFKPLRKIKLPEGSRPMDVKVTSEGKKLYVSNGRAGTVSIIDVAKEVVVNTIKVGKRPWGIALSPDEKLLYVANGPSNDISVVDLATEKEITRIPAGQSPWGLAIVPMRAEPVAKAF